MQRFEQYTATTAFVTPLYLIAIVLGTFGNALVIYFYITDIGIQRTFNYLLTNLAVADFVICAVFTPLLFAYRVHEKAEVIGFTPLCEISLFSSMFSVSLVYLVFPLMAYQRKDVMSRSLRATLSLTRRRVLMGTFWLSSFLSGAMMIILARSEFIDSGPSYVNMYRCIMINQRLDFYSQVGRFATHFHTTHAKKGLSWLLCGYCHEEPKPQSHRVVRSGLALDNVGRYFTVK